MQLSMSLLFLALVSLSPLCRAYSDADLEADKLRRYRRVSPRYTPEARDNLERLIRQHTEQILIDGVPIQGGRKSQYVKKALSLVVKEVAVGFFNELGASLWSLITGKAKIAETEE